MLCTVYCELQEVKTLNCKIRARGTSTVSQVQLTNKALNNSICDNLGSFHLCKTYGAINPGWDCTLLTTYYSTDKKLYRTAPPHPHLSDHYGAGHVNRGVHVEILQNQLTSALSLNGALPPKLNPHLCLIMHVGWAISLLYGTVHSIVLLPWACKLIMELWQSKHFELFKSLLSLPYIHISMEEMD